MREGGEIQWTISIEVTSPACSEAPTEESGSGAMRRPCAIAHVTSDVLGGSNLFFSRPQVVQPSRDCLANNSRSGPSPPTYRSMR